jgi:oxalate---CoA ligase
MSKSTIMDVLAANAARDPDRHAIVCAGLRPISFGDLLRHVQQVRSQLHAGGIGSTSRVGIALPRGPEAALLSIAVCCTSILVPLNPNLPAAELQAELDRLRLDVLILPGDAETPGWVAAASGDFGLFKVSKAVFSLEDVQLEQVRPVRLAKPASPLTGQSWAAIFRTSGTTGISKHVPVTHENLIEMARKMERWLELTPADRSACIMPIYYNAGFKATLLVPLLVGCSVAFPAATSPQDFIQWIEELRPTWLTASPAFLQAIVEKVRALPGDGPEHSLRFVLSTASYLPEPMRVELQRLLAVPVVEFYGMCEAGMMTAPALPPEVAKPGSVGRVPRNELAIRDDDGAFLGPGQEGEIMLRGPSVMPGYLPDDIEEGVPTGLDDGWLPTGDLGIVDADGFLTVVGRTKEIINRGGEKISPYSVEKALLCHPAVRQAAAFTVPHPRLGENVGTAVVLESGANVTSAQLIDFIYDRLAPYQMPRHVDIVDSLPVGPTGKISRRQLSAAFADPQRSTERPRTVLERLIAEIWERHLKRTDIGLDDDFFEIGGDSLQATEMLLEIEDLTRHRIATSNLRAQLTVRQLCETLVNAAVAKKEVITRAKFGKGAPLFFCHGDFNGWGFYGLRLAGLMKTDAPVYLLHPLVDGFDTIEEMAQRYITLIETVAPSGPIRLGGFCNGGLAAFEVASRLERAGRAIDKIVLIETHSNNARPVMRAIVPLARFIGGCVPGELGRRIRRGAPPIWARTGRLIRADVGLFKKGLRAMKDGSLWGGSQSAMYTSAMSKYLPPRIQGDLTCLLSEESLARPELDAKPWKRLARTVRAEVIPGDHTTCITRHVGDLAKRLDRILAS